MTEAAAFLFLTHACNLSCKHCYVSAAPALEGHMSPEHFRKILALLKASNICDVRLTGGEPMMHPNFHQYLAELNAMGIRPRLITNGIRLINSHSTLAILDSLSGCWISVFGLTQEQHQFVGGRAIKDLDAILAFAGRHTSSKSWIGISAVLTDVNKVALENFIDVAHKHGVRKLRFLFAEPSGRAGHSGAVFSNDSTSHNVASTIADNISELVAKRNFDYVTLNNPFDLTREKSRFGHKSCLLHDRRMWSFSPDGYIYSCCFNIYKHDHIVSNINDKNAKQILLNLQPGGLFAKKCEGLSKEFWGMDKPINIYTCPISAIEIKTNEILK